MAGTERLQPSLELLLPTQAGVVAVVILGHPQLLVVLGVLAAAVLVVMVLLRK